MTAGLLPDVPPASDTATGTGPVPGAGSGEAGVTAVIVVELTTATSLAGAPPKVTRVEGSPTTKLVPVIVTGVPPPVGPSPGTMPPAALIVGVASNVNSSAATEVPPVEVTQTSSGPGASEGVTTVALVSLTGVTLVPARPVLSPVGVQVPPNTTALRPVRPVPLSVTRVPPDVGP